MKWIVRLLLTSCLAYLSFFVLLYTRRFFAVQLSSMQTSMYLAGFVVFVLVVCGWLLIWRGLVVWTPARKTATAAVALLAQPVGFVAGLILAAGDEDFGWFLSAVLPTGFFIVATTAVWIPYARFRYRAAPATVAAVPCPDCGYDLRRLHYARCPECGGEFTLEQLVAAPVRR